MSGWKGRVGRWFEAGLEVLRIIISVSLLLFLLLCVPVQTFIADIKAHVHIVKTKLELYCQKNFCVEDVAQVWPPFLDESGRRVPTFLEAIFPSSPPPSFLSLTSDRETTPSQCSRSDYLLTV